MPRRTESEFRRSIILVVCLMGVLAYVNSFANGFVWDDASSVLIHKNVQDPSKFFQLFKEDQHAFGRGQGNFYRPLVSVSFMLDYFIASHGGAIARGELSATVFHFTNTAWHLAAALLLLALLTILDAPRFVRAVVPMLYVLHPLHTEAVTYISGRADPMAAALMFAGLCLAAMQATGSKRIAATIAASCCFAAALLCKESALIFPLLALIVAFAKPEPQTEDNGKPAPIKRLIPFFASLAVLAGYAALRLGVLKLKSESVPIDSSLTQRLVETGQSFALYVKLLFVPTGLHMERTLANTPTYFAFIGWALILIALGLLCESLIHKRTRIAAALLWFLITWFPISGLIPLNAPMAEHWLYVPMAGFMWALFEYLNMALKRWPAQFCAGALVFATCLFFMIATVARNNDWRDNETLFRATLAKNPESSRVHFNLAVTYEDILDNNSGAKRHFQEVLKLYEDKKQAAATESERSRVTDEELESRLSLGRIYLEQQNYSVAAQHFQIVLSIIPTEQHRRYIGTAALGLGKCYVAIGNFEEANKLFQQALAIQPEMQAEIETILRGA